MKSILKDRDKKHELIGGTLKREDAGIIARCICGWTSGHRFSGFIASNAMSDHRENPERDET